MKGFFIVLLITFSSTSVLNNSDTIKKYLHQAKNYAAIKKYCDITKHKQEKFKSINAYIPSFSPLNPNKQKRISSKFGKRFHPIDKKMKPHLGLDISAPYGTPVHSTASGIISKTKHSNVGYGNQIEVLHGFGFQTKYAHLYKIIVKEGKKVKKGDIIGFVGSSGKSTASHLHYEIKKNKKHIDPYPFCFLNL